VANLHFYHYPWDRNMLDLMGGTRTSPETMRALAAFTRELGIVPLIARVESTGFVYNRVWRAVKREVLHLVDDGVATFQDVDRAWMISYAQPMGPFGKMDLIGLDVIRDIENVYYGESDDPRDAPPPLLTDRVERGDLGVKTGRGFYTYPDPAYEREGFLYAGDEDEG
jgi:3-hydroxybutyryl-CoA dehydrogenase